MIRGGRPTRNNSYGFCDCGARVVHRLVIRRGSVITFKTGCHRCAHREADRLAADPGTTVRSFPIQQEVA